MELIDQHVESLIFTSGQPISEDEITTSVQRALDDKISKEDIDASIERLMEKYKSEDFAFEIVPISRGYHFMTKGAFHTTVGEHLKVISKKKLSRAALETLSIIAYKQPVTRIDLESIRGVSCDYTIQKLMEKELVEMQGRAEGPGRPLLYGTSEKFMDYFGIKDLKDLPKPKDFEMPETEVGEPAPIEVVVPKESNESTETEMSEKVGSDHINEDVKLAEDLEHLVSDKPSANIESEDDVEIEETASMLEVEEVRLDEYINEKVTIETEEIEVNGTSDLVQNGSEESQIETSESAITLEVEEIKPEELINEEVKLETKEEVESNAASDLAQNSSEEVQVETSEIDLDLEDKEVRSERYVNEEVTHEAEEVASNNASDLINGGSEKDHNETGESDLKIEVEEVRSDEYNSEEVKLETSEIVTNGTSDLMQNGSEEEQIESVEAESITDISLSEEKIEIQNSSEEEE